MDDDGIECPDGEDCEQTIGDRIDGAQFMCEKTPTLIGDQERSAINGTLDQDSEKNKNSIANPSVLDLGKYDQDVKIGFRSTWDSIEGWPARFSNPKPYRNPYCRNTQEKTEMEEQLTIGKKPATERKSPEKSLLHSVRLFLSSSKNRSTLNTM